MVPYFTMHFYVLVQNCIMFLPSHSKKIVQLILIRFLLPMTKINLKSLLHLNTCSFDLDFMHGVDLTLTRLYVTVTNDVVGQRLGQ